MKVQVGETGHVEYTGRAFNQDAQEAMGGDIVRALIELITNSDDAYAASADSGVGRIAISVDRGRGREWSAEVRDRAIGMTAEELVRKITRLGGRTSGFESGADRRGNLGRGAKDVAAFGEVSFEAIKSGRYACLLLRPDGTYVLEADERATKARRDSLGITRGAGTVVTIRVAAGVRCPRQQTLKTKLSGHYQLRDILSDQHRKVELHVGSSRDLLIYEYPDLPVVAELALEIDGYPDATANLVIWRHPARYDEGHDDPTRPVGILIKGRRAIYDNTLFKYEGNPHAGWFSGKLVCEYIDQLAQEHDNRRAEGMEPDPRNPIPIISRRREGLAPAHPFAQALRAAVEQPFGELIAAEEERARAEGSRLEDDQSRAALDQLGREISKFISDELRELEAEEEGHEAAGVIPSVALVPEFAYAYLGEDRTLTVQVRSDIAAPGDEVSVTTDPIGVVEPLDSQVTLVPHSRREELLVGRVRLRPIVDGDSALVTVTTSSDQSADAMVEVRESRTIVEDPVIPPEVLEFERSSYRVGLQREKVLEVRAPSDAIAANGLAATASSSAPAVVVRTPQIEFEFDEERDYWIASVRIEGRALGTTATVLVSLGEAVASTLVTVVRKEEGPTFRIKVVDEDMGHWRAVEAREADPDTGEDTRIIKVSGRHPALRGLVSQLTLRSRDARLVVAEAVSDAAVRIVVNQLYRLRRADEEFSSDRLYLEHSKRVLRLLPRAQSILLADLDEPTGVLIDARALGGGSQVLGGED